MKKIINILVIIFSLFTAFSVNAVESESDLQENYIPSVNNNNDYIDDLEGVGGNDIKFGGD
jgi:hypothetical protein